MDEIPSWNDVLQPGTQIRIEEKGRITPGRMFESPQTVEIIGVSEITGKDGDWPATVTVRGSKRDTHELFETQLDNLRIRQAVEKGEVSVLE